ncbi:hypothetical protein G9A89_005538 [Geosiphon pyriformis]|nr:hypothetical protein G9A89_005538 [Geosiphon pyriformis]
MTYPTRDLSSQLVQALRDKIKGQVFAKGEEGYQAARQIFNSGIEASPLILIKVEDTEDVSKAIRFANEHRLTVSIKSGGHGVPGWCIKGELVIDLSQINYIRVDVPEPQGSNRSYGTSDDEDSMLPSPPHAHGTVTFGAGCLVREIDQETSNWGYHMPLGAYPSVGTSLILGGGIGFLSRKYGLSMDNLIECDVVLADGRIITASETENPEIFWALRGAGTTIGVVTRFKCRIYSIKRVFSGHLIYSFNTNTTPALISHWRDCVKDVPRELFSSVIFTAGPTRGTGIIIIQICYVGNEITGGHYVDTIASFPGERCLMKDVFTRPFVKWQESVANVLKHGSGNRYFIKGDLINQLPDELITRTVEAFANGNTPGAVWMIQMAGGAINDIAPEATAFSHRDAKFEVVAILQWKDKESDQRVMAEGNGWLRTVVAPHSVGGPFPNTLGRDDPIERVIGCFGRENYERLVQIKRKHFDV